MQTVMEIYLLNFKGFLYAYMVIQYHIWVAKWLITGLNWHLPPPMQLKPLFRLHSSHVPRSWCIDGLNRTVIHMGIYIYLSSSSPLSLSLFRCDMSGLSFEIAANSHAEYGNQFVCIKRQSKNHIEKHLHLHDSTRGERGGGCRPCPLFGLSSSPFCQSTAARSVNEWMNE